MTNTPEQTLSDLLATVTEAAAQFRKYEKLHLAKGTADGHVKAVTNSVWAERLEDALPAIREYMEMVKGLRDIGGQMALHLHLVADQLEDKIDARKATELANKFRALSRLGGK